MKLLALVLVLFGASCGGIDAPSTLHYPGQDEAKALADAQFVADGYDDTGIVFSLWYRTDDNCLPDPWNFGGTIDPEITVTLDDHHCRWGRTLYMVWWSIVAVVIRGDGSIADTSFAHELGHVAKFDPWHDHRPLWDTTIPTINATLREAGL